MKTMTKWQLPLLAVVTLLVAACDPFPAKPGGDPKIIRVVSSATFSTTVDPVTNSAAVVVPDVWENSTTYIEFNKPLDGRSIQATGNYDANNDPVLTSISCAFAGSPLTKSANWNALTQICYVPDAATDGGMIKVTEAATGLLQLNTGSDYTLSGSVKDFEGKSVAISVSLQPSVKVKMAIVSGVPRLRVVGYSGALGYTAARALDNAGVAGPYDTTFPVQAGHSFNDATAFQGNTYWYAASAYSDAAGTTKVFDYTVQKFPVPLDTTVTITRAAGAVTLDWNAYLNATNTYKVERAPDNAGVPGTYATLATGVSTTTNAVEYVDTTSTDATSYWYRVSVENVTPATVYDASFIHGL